MNPRDSVVEALKALGPQYTLPAREHIADIALGALRLDGHEIVPSNPPIPEGDLPKPLTVWKHRNGNIYTVFGITNLPNDPRYPTTVVYIGPNGNRWSRRADDWHRSMTPYEGDWS